MFNTTSNPYKLKYLITAISGAGVPCVYLPEVPTEDKILFQKEQKFTRPEMPEAMRKEYKFWRKQIESGNTNYVSPLAKKIADWEDTEWERSQTGIWFWNNGTPTYITKFYYWYLSTWQTYFGYPDYRETDKEITYMLEYVEEDPNCYGLILNTIRRYGKSSIMGAWVTYRTTMNFGHYSGMQGEKDAKIAKFYDQMVKKPFLKLPHYYKPEYDTASTLSTEIKFERSAKRGKAARLESDDDDEGTLESIIDFRPSGEAEYDGSILHSYLMEEAGKVLTANVNERWKIVKPCLRKGRIIRGKAFLGTTVEFMDTANKGGKAYKKLFYESDFDDRQPDGRTKSGLYASFLPGDCAYEGFYDEWGIPNLEKARASLLEERESAKDDPKDLSDLIRKYPLSIKEIFYINTESCEFNATILQDRRSVLDVATDPFFSKIDFYWENNVRFSRVLFKHNPTSGWCKISWLPTDIDKDANLVDKKLISGEWHYSPRNDGKFSAGIDPIDHGVIIEGKSSDDEFTSSRRSKPVLMLKSKYDSSIDGLINHEEMIQRAKDKYPYKTNKYILMMDTRQNDPNVLYERALMICWFFGVSLHVEAQKYSIINYFHNHNCGGFILNKYEPDWVKAKRPMTEGTPASQTIIQDYTSEIATYVEYFGHTIPFRELVEDLLLFTPRKTTEFDYAVAMGFTELSAKIRPKQQPKKVIDLSQYMNIYDQSGELCN